MTSPSTVSTTAKVHIILETKNEKEHIVQEQVEPWPKNLYSLPLVNIPLGQPIETTDPTLLQCRGLLPVTFRTLSTYVEIVFQLSGLEPHIVPHTDFHHSKYRFTPHIRNPLAEEKQQLFPFPTITVDTTFFSRSIVYKTGLDPENMEGISDADLDPNILLPYQTGEEVKSIPTDPRLKNYYPKPAYMVGVERVFDEQKRFQCIKTTAECANKDFACWATFDIVPIRQEPEYSEFFSLSTERTVIFKSLMVQIPLPKVPEIVSRWMKLWNETKTTTTAPLKEEASPLVQTTELDLTPAFAIPLVPEHLEAWFEHGKDMLYEAHYGVNPAEHKDEIRQENMDELYEKVSELVKENYETMRGIQECRFVEAQEYLLETTPVDETKVNAEPVLAAVQQLKIE